MNLFKGLDAPMYLILLALAFAVASSKAPHLPKPITGCPDCRDATSTLATAKE